MNLWTVFITGLFTGGLTCLAVQGGLLATTIAQRERERFGRSMGLGKHASPILYFLVAKLLAYTILGFLLGWFGSLFQLSLGATVVLQTIVGIFMIGTALSLLDVHPIFRYFIIQPPKFLTRLVRNQSKSRDFFAPLTLGAFTVFIPCGTTQAMMALSIASGSPILGALTMFVFVVGTSPLFFGLGYATVKLGEVLQQKFMKIAAASIIVLAVFNINGAVALSGSSLTLESIVNDIYCTALSFCNKNRVAGVIAPVEEATISINRSGYTPNSLTVKAGSSVTLHLVNKGGSGCASAFTIPSLGLQKVVPPGTSSNLVFTAPSQPTQLAFMCSMNMFRGTIYVI